MSNRKPVLLADERANSGAFANMSLWFSAVVCGSVGLLITTESTQLLKVVIGLGFVAIAGWMALVSIKPEFDRVNRGEAQ